MKRVSIPSLHAVAKDRKPGYVEEAMRLAVKSNSTHIWLESHDFRRIRRRYALPPQGPGSMLKSMLATVGITASKTCKCNTMARKMDEWGPDESLKHIDEIVAVMEETASKRKMIFSRLAAKALVRLAIWRSRRAKR